MHIAWHNEKSIACGKALRAEGLAGLWRIKSYTGTPNENIVQNHLNIALLTVF